VHFIFAINTLKRKKPHIIVFSILGILSVVAVWELAAYFTGNTNVFPTFSKSVVTLSKLAVTENFWAHIGITLFRGILGGILALIIGFVLGLFSGINPSFRAFLMPWIVILRSIPVISVILLAIIWLMPGHVPLFVMLITVSPIIVSEVTEGIIEIKTKYREMLTIYKVSFTKQITHVILPGLLPRLASGFSLGMGYGWRAIVIGEVLSRPQWGIGDRMARSQSYFKVDELIAWTVVLIIISYFFDKFIDWTKNKLIKWR
jgi:NitT/TauT family transport system permease protein